MNIKNLAVKGTMVAGAIAAMGGIAILNYDQHPFYQDNLDAAYHKELRIERYIANEYQNIISPIKLKFIVYFPVGSLTVDNPYDLLRKTHR